MPEHGVLQNYQHGLLFECSDRFSPYWTDYQLESVAVTVCLSRAWPTRQLPVSFRLDLSAGQSSRRFLSTFSLLPDAGTIRSRTPDVPARGAFPLPKSHTKF